MCAHLTASSSYLALTLRNHSPELYKEASRYTLDNYHQWPASELVQLSQSTLLKLERRYVLLPFASSSTYDARSSLTPSAPAAPGSSNVSSSSVLSKPPATTSANPPAQTKLSARASSTRNGVQLGRAPSASGRLNRASFLLANWTRLTRGPGASSTARCALSSPPSLPQLCTCPIRPANRTPVSTSPSLSLLPPLLPKLTRRSLFDRMFGLGILPARSWGSLAARSFGNAEGGIAKNSSSARYFLSVEMGEVGVGKKV